MRDLSLDASGRREFMKAVVAVGGSTALSACLDRTGGTDLPAGVEDPSSLPVGQHHWNAHLSTDEHGNVANARHHVLRFLNYPRDQPTEADRRTIENALTTLERAYEWSNEGIVFTLGYSPAYFERFGAPPTGVDLPAPEPLADFEAPELESFDAVLHLASDSAEGLVEAEEVLFGSRSTANGVAVEARLSDVFEAPGEYPGRRTGFVGGGLPAQFAKEVPDVPDDAVAEDAPLFMGFKSA
ncbi:MAG: Tat pathway signal protein, partial [Halobacteriales archaeon]